MSDLIGTQYLVDQAMSLISARDDEIARLRAWITSIGGLPDVDADERGWMAEHALSGKPPPNDV